MILAGFLVLLGGSALSGQVSGIELGVIMGEPTGISVKYWAGRRWAADAVAAWSLVEGGYLHLHADYLVHNFSFLSVSGGQMPVYTGLGPLARLGEQDTRIGARVPLGVSFLFDRVPLDLFLELAPVLSALPAVGVELEGGIGLRFVFSGMNGEF